MRRRGAEHLNEHGWRRLRLRLELGDTHGEIAVAWVIAQDLRRLYQADTLDAARRHLDQLLAAMTSCPVPEVGRLGRTLTS